MSKQILPGLIDPHVHLRDPGQTDKEDFFTGTSAALAGGYTTVIDMPNNPTPITTLERLNEKMQIAREKIVCDVGFHFGSVGDNLDEFEKFKIQPRHSGDSERSPVPSGIGRSVEDSRISQRKRSWTSPSTLSSGPKGQDDNFPVFGLKLYLNHTTGNFLLDKSYLEKIFAEWPSELPILVHAEEQTFDDVLEVLRKYPRKLHLCHMSRKYELERIIKAKNSGLPVTCGMTPHHLFLTENDLNHLKNLGMMRPPLRGKKDVDFLWKHLDAIDLVESDHAPHTLEEKQADNPPFGVPGLETTLSLLLTAVSENRLTIDDVIRLCHTGPAKIFLSSFDYSNNRTTYIEVDPKASYEIKNENLLTKCKWSPFDGWKVKGKVLRVFLRGKKVFEDGEVLVKPGFGRILSFMSF